MARSIALLRAVNVGGRKLPMAELRTLCGELGWEDVETYIQSGNVVFTGKDSASALETRLEKAIAAHFHFHSDVIVRTASQWRRLIDSNPFPEESDRDPNRILAGLAKSDLAVGAATAIIQAATAGERVEEAGGALWFHYPQGVGTSKLTPKLIDRAAGSPVTARNWRTVTTLMDMAE